MTTTTARARVPAAAQRSRHVEPLGAQGHATGLRERQRLGGGGEAGGRHGPIMAATAHTPGARPCAARACTTAVPDDVRPHADGRPRATAPGPRGGPGAVGRVGQPPTTADAGASVRTAVSSLMTP